MKRREWTRRAHAALDLKASGSGGVTPEQAAEVGHLIYELKKRQG